jgi:hypothetical protein
MVSAMWQVHAAILSGQMGALAFICATLSDISINMRSDASLRRKLL